MTVGGRGEARQRMVRRSGMGAIVLVVLALLFLLSGHWVLGIVFGLAAAAAVWAFVQLRSLR